MPSHEGKRCRWPSPISKTRTCFSGDGNGKHYNNLLITHRYPEVATNATSQTPV